MNIWSVLKSFSPSFSHTISGSVTPWTAQPSRAAFPWDTVWLAGCFVKDTPAWVEHRDTLSLLVSCEEPPHQLFNNRAGTWGSPHIRVRRRGSPHIRTSSLQSLKISLWANSSPSVEAAYSWWFFSQCHIPNSDIMFLAQPSRIVGLRLWIP